MSAAQQPAPFPPPSPSAGPPRWAPALLVHGPPVAAALAVAVVGGWAVSRTGAADRATVAVLAGATALLLGAVVALAGLWSRTAGKLAAEAARAGLAAETAGAAVAEQAALQAGLAAETARATALEREADRLTDVILPRAVEQLRSGKSAPTVLARLERSPGAAHQRLLEAVVGEVGASERMRAAVMAACANTASRVQALSTSMLADLRDMEMRHSEDVLGDLLLLDHQTAQAGRMADSIAVITGSRSGRRWTRPIVMESVLRGALGRINAYRRVRLHSASTAAVAGYAAEGVMHALAEIMDNATTFSPPTEEVHVYVQETHTGVVVTVEDGGLVMPPSTLLRAEKLVSAAPLDLRDLSGTRFGLAVVGCLARKYGLTVSFRPSSRGGTGVVVLIPPKLITRPREDWPPLPAQDLWQYDRTPAGLPARGALTDAGRTDAGRTGPGGADRARTGPERTDRERGTDRQRSDGVRTGGARTAVAPAVPLPKRARGRTLADSGHLGLIAAAAQPPSPAALERDAQARATSGERFRAFRRAALGEPPVPPLPHQARKAGRAAAAEPHTGQDTDR
ncbi:ATP-binding protein [Streptomyces sp. NBC_01477]|uniref:ATP-binding protein n=1 Tax=Streptomyces sp. NBC_01477 TaxID=2976015 RepID=UPI002E372A71|nr:ATP-binding protein [Streptomyces sp. NBC_01477]